MSLRAAALCVLLAVGAGAVAGPARAQDDALRLFTIGTASVGGNYYAIGRAVCRLMNREGPADLRCSPEPTPGSQYNLIGLAAGDLDFAFVQSDWQHRAYEGIAPFAASPMPALRSVMSLYAEAVTLVVRAEAQVAALSDLRGKVVDLGSPSTARRGTNLRVLRGIGVDPGSFARVQELSADAVGPELCAGRIDAAFIVLGHPNARLGALLGSCDLRLVSLDNAAVADFVATNSDFETYTIPAGTYGPGLPPVRTVSTLATLVTRADVADALVAPLARTMLMQHAVLADSAPVLGARDVQAMRRAGLSAPLHPAARAVFDAVAGDAGQ